MKNIYIATSENDPVGVVLADNEDIAWAFFQGRGDKVTSIEEINPLDQEGSLVILLTSKKTIDRNDSFAVKTRKWKRGQ